MYRVQIDKQIKWITLAVCKEIWQAYTMKKQLQKKHKYGKLKIIKDDNQTSTIQNDPNDKSSLYPELFAPDNR